MESIIIGGVVGYCGIGKQRLGEEDE